MRRNGQGGGGPAETNGDRPRGLARALAAEIGRQATVAAATVTVAPLNHRKANKKQRINIPTAIPERPKPQRGSSALPVPQLSPMD